MANGNPVVLGNADTSTKQTTVTAITPATQAGLRVQNYNGTGIAAGALKGTALTAGSAGGTAIVAESFAGLGIDATCVDTRDIPGISVAVRGTVQGGVGVLGNNVRGRFPHAGVSGTSLLGIGVDGFSRTDFGVRGMTRSNAVSGAGVMGIGSPGHGVIGIARQTATTPAVPPPFVTGGPLFAGLFFGNFQVQGDFTVTGHKSAVVPHPDGTHRRLYCVESPESWFEDFGSGKLAGGRAMVALDETFAKLVTCKDYHVFLTPEGDCNGLYVHRKSGSGFEVRELRKGASSVGFSYRIVARRRDVKGKRLEIVELGRLPEKADAVIATPKPSGKESKGRLADELAALVKQGKQKKKPASRAKKK
jgi:hypothetical protein